MNHLLTSSSSYSSLYKLVTRRYSPSSSFNRIVQSPQNALKKSMSNCLSMINNNNNNNHMNHQYHTNRHQKSTPFIHHRNKQNLTMTIDLIHRYYATTSSANKSSNSNASQEAINANQQQQKPDQETKEEETTEEAKIDPEVEAKAKKRRRRNWIIFLSVFSLLGLSGFTIYKLFNVVMEGGTILEKMAGRVEGKYANKTSKAVEKASMAMHQGMEKLIEALEKDQQLREKVELVLGELDHSSDPHNENHLRLLNTNFVQLISHRLYFLVRKDGHWNKNYYEARIQYFFPVVNSETGAIAIMKATLLTEDGMNEESDALHLESVHLCDAGPFAVQFSSQFFAQIYEFFMEKDLVYGWHNYSKNEHEIEVYRNKELQNRFKSVLPTLLPPAIKPNLEPLVGFLFPDTIDTRLLLPPTPAF